MKTFVHVMIAPIVCSLLGCSEKTDTDFKSELISTIHDSIDQDLVDLVIAARNLQAAAPTRAWDPATDAAAIEAMREAWKRMRTAYEHVEGAIAPLFVDLETQIDGRYDAYLAGLGKAGDRNPFDAVGVIGMHAIERILYAPAMRRAVIDYEQSLAGYRAAAYPSTDDEAIEFKTQLVGRLIEDASELHIEWSPAAIDLPTAYLGLVGLMNEQQEKIIIAAKGAEESRYANATLFDLRNNLGGTEKLYDLFRAWIQSKPTGEQTDAAILRKFEALRSLYEADSGDALPAVPMGWSSDHPTPANLATPFGTLWYSVHESVDPSSNQSVVVEMNRVAQLLGFPEFVDHR